MKKTLIIITILTLIIGIVAGIVLEDKFDILKISNKEEVEQKYNAVQKQYFEMVKDKHDRELIMKSYDFLEYNETIIIDYSIKPIVSKVDNPYGNHFFPDDYYVISFQSYELISEDKLFKSKTPYEIAVGIDFKTEKIIKILPTD